MHRSPETWAMPSSRRWQESSHAPSCSPDVFEKALFEHAYELGIDLNQEPHYRWIAEESLVAPLSDGWVQLKQEEGEHAGSLYYYNEVSGESQWEHPMDFHYRAVYAAEKEKESQWEEPLAGSPGGRWAEGQAEEVDAVEAAQGRVAEAEARAAAAEASVAEAEGRAAEAEAKAVEADGKQARAEAKAARAEHRLAEATRGLAERDREVGRVDRELLGLRAEAESRDEELARCRRDLGLLRDQVRCFNNIIPKMTDYLHPPTHLAPPRPMETCRSSR